MCTVRIDIPAPGTFAPIASETPSSGWTWISSTFGRSPSPAIASNGGCGALLELDRDRRLAPREPLARPHVERRVRPAPVVDVELRGDVRLGQRVRVDARLLAVRRAPPRPRRSRGRTARGRPTSARACASTRSTFTFSFAHRVGGEVDRRLHRRQREELQQVVLEDVADRAGLLVVAGAALDPHRLGDRDLDVVDELAVPDRLEDAVREAQRQQVLDGLLAEVVVDAEDLVLGEQRLQRRRSARAPRRGRGRTASRRSRASSPPRSRRSPISRDDRRERLRRDGEVVERGCRRCRAARRARPASRPTLSSPSSSAKSVET